MSASTVRCVTGPRYRQPDCTWSRVQSTCGYPTVAQGASMEKTTTVPGGKPPPGWIPDRTSFSGISAGKERYAKSDCECRPSGPARVAGAGSTAATTTGSVHNATFT